MPTEKIILKMTAGKNGGSIFKNNKLCTVIMPLIFGALAGESDVFKLLSLLML
jgi:hypothetical protein